MKLAAPTDRAVNPVAAGPARAQAAAVTAATSNAAMVISRPAPRQPVVAVLGAVPRGGPGGRVFWLIGGSLHRPRWPACRRLASRTRPSPPGLAPLRPAVRATSDASRNAPRRTAS